LSNRRNFINPPTKSVLDKITDGFKKKEKKKLEKKKSSIFHRESLERMFEFATTLSLWLFSYFVFKFCYYYMAEGSRYIEWAFGVGISLFFAYWPIKLGFIAFPNDLGRDVEELLGNGNAVGAFSFFAGKSWLIGLFFVSFIWAIIFWWFT